MTNKKISRRPFLQYALAATALPRCAWSVGTANPDAAVIGAGAAGLATARTLLDAEITV